MEGDLPWADYQPLPNPHYQWWWWLMTLLGMLKWWRWWICEDCAAAKVTIGNYEWACMRGEDGRKYPKELSSSILDFCQHFISAWSTQCPPPPESYFQQQFPLLEKITAYIIFMEHFSGVIKPLEEPILSVYLEPQQTWKAKCCSKQQAGADRIIDAGDMFEDCEQ